MSGLVMCCRVLSPPFELMRLLSPAQPSLFQPAVHSIRPLHLGGEGKTEKKNTKEGGKYQRKIYLCRFLPMGRRFNLLCYQVCFPEWGYPPLAVTAGYLSLPFPWTTFLLNLFAHFSDCQPSCALNGLVKLSRNTGVQPSKSVVGGRDIKALSF